MKLSQLGLPFTCLVLSEPSVKQCLRIIDEFEERVDAFEVNLPPLDPGALSDIFTCTSRPCIATMRRAEFMAFYGYEDLPAVSENSRAEALKRAAGLGAAAVDFELDTFREQHGRRRLGGTGNADHDAAGSRLRPAELSADPKIIRAQASLAEEIKSMGAEVILSCHTQTVLRENDAVEIVHAVRRRGGQLAKIVGLTQRREDLIGMLAGVMTLKKEAEIPFSVMNVGAVSALGRLVSVLAGSSWVYCRPPTRHSYGGQPTVDQTIWFLETFGLREA